MGNGFCHDSRSIDYRRPYGAVPCGTTVNLYLEANTQSLPESVRNLYRKEQAVSSC